MSDERKEAMQDKITINGITYVPETQIPGNRAVVVVDRGWIFAGDVSEENGRIRLTRALHVFRWTGGQGFAGMIDNPLDASVDLRPCQDVDLPADAEIFRVPVRDELGAGVVRPVGNDYGNGYGDGDGNGDGFGDGFGFGNGGDDSDGYGYGNGDGFGDGYGDDDGDGYGYGDGYGDGDGFGYGTVRSRRRRRP